MKEYIERCLRKTIRIEANTEIYKKLPLMYKGYYDLYTVFLEEIEWLIACPKTEIRLNMMRSNYKQIEKISNLNCAFYFNKLNHYSKEIMMNEGIAFIIADKQMYLPFLGMLLSKKDDRKLAPVHTISFLTQKLLLCALYEKWQGMNVTRIAERMGVTKMSITRCLDEIEYLDINVLDVSGKTRKVSVQVEPKVLWKNIKPFLRNPVIARFQLSDDINLRKKAGISALCEYSMLSDNDYPTYGITKKDLQEVNLKSFRQISKGEEIGCEILELGYFIDYSGRSVQDPLSVLLSISEKDIADERVKACIDEMLEDYVW